jgi:hypothetical protein
MPALAPEADPVGNGNNVFTGNRSLTESITGFIFASTGALAKINPAPASKKPALNPAPGNAARHSGHVLHAHRPSRITGDKKIRIFYRQAPAVFP